MSGDRGVTRGVLVQLLVWQQHLQSGAVEHGCRRLVAEDVVRGGEDWQGVDTRE